MARPKESRRRAGWSCATAAGEEGRLDSRSGAYCSNSAADALERGGGEGGRAIGILRKRLDGFASEEDAKAAALARPDAVRLRHCERR